MCLQVTPSSKVVGDLAQFMVQNDLDDAKLVEKASSLNLPDRSPTPHLLPLMAALPVYPLNCSCSLSRVIDWCNAHTLVVTVLCNQ